MADARLGRFDVVLVWASDRIARSAKHFLEVLDELSRLNIEYVSFRENIDTGGPMGGYLPGCGSGGPPQSPCVGPNCKKKYWITVSYYPLGAKIFGGHIGVAIGQEPDVKNNDTSGWAPGWEGSPLLRRQSEPNGLQKFFKTMAAIPIHPGVLRDDKLTYTGWKSPHVDLYYKVTQSQRNFAQLDYDIRATQSGLPSSCYDLYTRNCAQFAEDILHDADVPGGVPDHGIF